MGKTCTRLKCQACFNKEDNVSGTKGAVWRSGMPARRTCEGEEVIKLEGASFQLPGVRRRERNEGRGGEKDNIIKLRQRRE